MQTFTPKEYLKIDIASNFGHDKETWNFRIDWFDQMEPQLESLVNQADEPALFYAGVKAYRDAEAGKASGYPISLDATSSGAQLLAIMVGCKKSALLCNVIDSGDREDLYKNIYELMCSRINEKGRIDQPKVKKAVMTALYGSKAMPKRVFGEGELLSTFYETMEEEAPGIWELNQSLLDLWQSDALMHSWVLPDNFHVNVKVMDDNVDTVHFMNEPYEVYSKVNRPTKEGLSIGANTTHSIDGLVVREMTARCDYDPNQVLKLLELIAAGEGKVIHHRPKDRLVHTLLGHYVKSGFLSARIINQLDERNIGLIDPGLLKELLMSLPEKPFKVLSIHDCFRCLPNYGNDLRKQYNQILYKLSCSNILQFIASQIIGHGVSVSKYDDISNDILNTNYALS